MSPLRRLLRSDVGTTWIARLAALYLRLVYLTSRFTVIGGVHLTDLTAAGRPFIVAFWHGRMLLMPHLRPPDLNLTQLSSNSRDGQVMVSTLARFGIPTVRGSSGRDGLAGLRAMLRVLKSGDSIGITPDGPRGPRMRAASGAITAARLAGVPILPISCAASRRRVVRSWDRLCVPLPFSHGVYVIARPVTVAPDADAAAMEAAREELESRLNAATLEADLVLGLPTVEPAPASASPTSSRIIGADGP